MNWIENWLTDRIQQLLVDVDVSNGKALLSGITQGSV